MGQTRVLLIAGAAHGGTTITSVLLGQHPEVFVTGRMRGFPNGDLFDEDNSCSCGEPAAACAFWREVRERFACERATSELDRLIRLYGILSKVSGRPSVVDVTHNASDVERFLGEVPLDFRLLHVCRELEAVVYSRLRLDREIGRVKAHGPRRLLRVASVARHWTQERRRFFRAQRCLGERASRIDYEALCRAPHDVLERVGRFMGVDYGDVCDGLQRGAPLGQPFHFIRGNIRLRSKLQQQKRVQLRYDDAYLRQMRPIERLLSRASARLA